MAKVAGRRNDETADSASQQQGAEKWTLIVALSLAVAAVGALTAFAGGLLG
jgi:hypothetical protein